MDSVQNRENEQEKELQKLLKSKIVDDMIDVCSAFSKGGWGVVKCIKPLVDSMAHSVQLYYSLKKTDELEAQILHGRIMHNISFDDAGEMCCYVFKNVYDVPQHIDEMYNILRVGLTKIALRGKVRENEKKSEDICADKLFNKMIKSHFIVTVDILVNTYSTSPIEFDKKVHLIKDYTDLMGSIMMYYFFIKNTHQDTISVRESATTELTKICIQLSELFQYDKPSDENIANYQVILRNTFEVADNIHKLIVTTANALMRHICTAKEDSAQYNAMQEIIKNTVEQYDILQARVDTIENTFKNVWLAFIVQGSQSDPQPNEEEDVYYTALLDNTPIFDDIP